MFWFLFCPHSGYKIQPLPAEYEHHTSSTTIIVGLSSMRILVPTSRLCYQNLHFNKALRRHTDTFKFEKHVIVRWTGKKQLRFLTCYLLGEKLLRVLVLLHPNLSDEGNLCLFFLLFLVFVFILPCIYLLIIFLFLIC